MTKRSREPNRAAEPDPAQIARLVERLTHEALRPENTISELATSADLDGIDDLPAIKKHRFANGRLTDVASQQLWSMRPKLSLAIAPQEVRFDPFPD